MGISVWNKLALGCMALLAILCGPIQAASLTAAEIATMESDLGVALSSNEVAQLSEIVYPTNMPSWRSDAYARIDTHRKADLDIQVADQYGDPVEGAEVEIKLTKNQFDFGGTFSVKDFSGAGDPAMTMTTDTYRERLLTMFNSLGLNNGFKPRLTSLHEYLPGFKSWAVSNSIPVRGHLLIWPGVDDENNHLTPAVLADVQAVEAALTNGSSQATIDALRDDLRTTVQSEMISWASQHEVYEWDVINEPLSNHRVQDALDDYDVMADWFEIAESNKVSAECGLRINEFQIISAMSDSLTPGYYTDRRDRYMTEINRLLSNNAPITGIGFQSRIKHERREPQLIYDRLEEWATAYPDLTLAGTEFEVQSSESTNEWKWYIYSDEERAQITEEMMTQYYSHPQVTGLFAWDTISNEDTALVDYDGNPTRNGLVWYYLHRIRYNTDATLATGLDGRAGLRAFKGDYEIIVRYKGQEYVASLAHTNDQSIVFPLNSSTVDGSYTSEIIDAWNYEGLTNNAGLSSAVSTGSVGGVSTPDYALASIQNEAVRWQSDGVTDSLYRNIEPSSSAGANTGPYQLSMDYLDADFSASAAVSNGSGRVTLGVRNNSNVDVNFRLVFNSGDGISPEYWLQATDDFGSNQTLATFPGTTLGHLSVRAVYDFDQSGFSGSYRVYYRFDGGSEVAAYTAGQLPAGFALDKLRLSVQTYNGGVNWAAGDQVFTDNLVLRSLSEPPPVFFTVDPINRSDADAGVIYAGQSIAGTASNAASYSIVAGPTWLDIAENGDLSGTPTPDDAGPNSWIVQASNGIETDTAVLHIYVDGAGGGPGSDISIISGPTTDSDDPVTGEMVFNSVSVQAGDIVAIATSPNKGAGVNHMTLQWSGTTGVDGTVSTVESPDLSNRTTYLFYVEIINSGTYDFTVVPDETALTGQSSLFVLRADSGTIGVADTATLAQSTASPGLSFDFSTLTLPAAMAIEAYASIGGTSLTVDSNYSTTQNANGRSIAYSGSVTGSAWNKTHSSDAGTQDYVGAGAVFYEVTAGAGNAPPVFDSDPVVESTAYQGTAYYATLADHASDGDSDPMTFFMASGPSWLGVATNGTLTGTPSAVELGANSWKVAVSDGLATNFATLEIEVASSAPPVASPDRMRLHPTNNYNVLFIAIDDMRPLINAYGETEPLVPSTPNMDQLAAGGIMFANAYCQQAVCNASRASLLTGLRPDTTMCWKLDTFFRDQVPDVITLPQHFGDNGYRVHGIGKIFHNTTPTSQDESLSWNEGWSSSAADYIWYETDKAALEDAGTNKVSATDAGEINTRDGNRSIVDEDYNDGYAAVQGVAKIAEYAASYQSSDTPFFLAVGFQKPHMPFNCPKTYWDLYDPVEIDLTGYTGIRQMPVEANKFTAPYGGEPSGFLDVTGTVDDGMPTATEARHLIHGYLACVSFIDAQIGKLLDALEDPDGNPGTDDSVADNTIIVLWGDHGFHLGDHNGFWAKHSNYEISTRVPLIISTPAMDELGSAGSRSVGMVELIDLYPTLVDLCSLPTPNQPAGQALQGTTLLPLLEDPAQPWKKAVFSQYQRNINDSEPGDVPVSSSGTGMGYTIRTERYRYTEWWVTESTDETDRHIIKAGITEPGHIELYDYVADPGETTNLASNASYSNLVSELSALLNDSNPISAGDGWALPEVDAPNAYPLDDAVWKTNYMSPGRTMAELDFDSDPDGDTVINRFEYKFGTHPFVAEASPVFYGFGTGGLYITYPDVEPRTNVLLEVTTTTDLTSGSWSSSGVSLTNESQQGNATIKTGSVPTADPTRFLRLEATDL